MKIVSNKEYLDIKYNFLKQHNDWHVETSQMDSNGQYCKNYICDNGDILTEINRPVYKTVHVTYNGLEINTTVHLLESEMFSNKFQSIYTYENY